MEPQYITVKEVMLNNHCPECYSSDGLQLTFKQRFVETAFYKAISTDVKHKLFCLTCSTEIFPVRWTADLEQIFDYHQRAFEPKVATFKLKKITLFLLVFAVVLVVLLGVYFFTP